MAKFPPPPAQRDLANISLDIAILAKGTTLWRIYFQGGTYPTGWNSFRAWGPTGSRFDHQTLPRRTQRRKILYAAADGPTCFAEVFQATRTIDRRRDHPWLVEFELDRDVSLLDLCDAWPTRSGASMAINSGSRARARRWSRAIYGAYPKLDGIRYASSMNANQPAVALFERAETALAALPVFHRMLSDAVLDVYIRNAARRFGYAVV